MNKITAKSLSALAVLAIFSSALVVTNSYADDEMMKERVVMVGGAAMYPYRNIVENALNSKDHTTLVAAIKAAGLVDVLQGKGPFTVFAPTNEAFKKLPEGIVETLLKPENKAKLVNILTFHVVPGTLSAKDLVAKIEAGKGEAKLKTVEGEDLIVKLVDGKVKVFDRKGDVGTVTIPDVFQSNGVIHVIDTVLLPA